MATIEIEATNSRGNLHAAVNRNVSYVGVGLEKLLSPFAAIDRPLPMHMAA